MGYYLGIDGGGSKTIFALADEKGCLIASWRGGSASHKQIGIEGVAGSLLLKPGINVVAGTGSIACGRNKAGEAARSGGWSEWFSDEGSGRWLGMKGMELFSRESDGPPVRRR